ncbi:tryptophan dimethylallyltransferase family protein [Chamaesiphon sp.]|uniref:tryptophan dimethylallyltransferase family protein n=1 Tax=Chamaesiphon sp. TaxID=2814140 RepID=UPI0035932293
MTNHESISTASKSIDTSENYSVNTEFPATDLHAIEHHPQVGFDPEKLVPSQTYVECGVEKLTALCHAVGLTDKLPQITEIFGALTASWGDRRVGDTSTWASDVSDDCAPFEFSLALDPDKAELRVLVEAQGSDPNLQSNWQAGRDLNQHLAQHYNVSLDRFEQIADLFAPTNSAAKFSMWHAVCFYPDKEPSFKLYLNPQAQAPSRAAAVVEESLVRLGFTHAWPTLAETAAQRGPDKDQFVYFSLDLAAHDKARVKVYIRHHDATPVELEAALSAAHNYIPGDAIEFCQAMAPGQTSFSAKSVISAFSWVEEDDATPSSSTLHIPISNYATNDRAVSDRIDSYFSQYGLPISTYYSTLQALATRPLEAGIGMQSYTSLRREHHKRRVTVYLNPEVNVVRPPLKIVPPQLEKSCHSLEEISWHYKTNSIEDHPFFQRLHREPANLTNLWLFFANVQEGIISHFTTRLSLIVDRIDDDLIRGVFAKQLHEELGNGDESHIHKEIFARFILGLEPYKPELVTREMLAPGLKLSQGLETLYSDPNPYVGVGAAILMEVRGEQRDKIVTKELVRTTLDSSVSSWFYLHGELEGDHADEVLNLARQIDNSDGDKAAVLQGVKMTADVLWNFCNDMYQACYL